MATLAPDQADLARDPVCGMRVDPARSPHRAEHAGAAFHFCCARCREKFLADPARFLGDAPSPPAPAVPGATYTCPMHPAVQAPGPAACPLCGMALEPAVPTAADGPDPELIDFRRRAWWALALGLPVVAIAMGGHLIGGALGHALSGPAARWAQLLLATPVVLWAGWPLLLRGAQSVRHGHLNMFTLIALGAAIAWAASAVATLAPDLVPAAFLDAHGAPPLGFEAAVAIVGFALLGQVLELRARARTGQAIRGLLALAPPTARRVAADGTEGDVSLAEVRVGDTLRVRPGDRVPLDGIVLDGASAVDESLLTGEAMPVAKLPGSRVVGGTQNGDGTFTLRAERVGEATVLAGIVRLVAAAQRSQAPIARLADRVAGVFVPIVLAAALLAGLAWAVWGPEPRGAHALLAAITVLVVACPCALGLATPMAVTVGVGSGARAGVLVRDAAALERLARIDTLVIDKTGTLTAGRPEVVAVAPLPGFDEAEVLRVAAALEGPSAHPLADAVRRAAAARGNAIPAVAQFVQRPGAGVTGVVEGRPAVLGTAALLADAGVDAAPLLPRAAELRETGATAFLLAMDGKPAGVIAVADAPRPEAAAVLAALRAEGLRVILATGDAVASAAPLAARLGLSEVHAGLLPADKLRLVEELRAAGRRLAMAGDGINDAPALAAAEVGIAMGGGADIAVDAADVTLLGGDLRGLLRARRLARATLRTIRQNLAFAFGYNLLGVPLAAGALYPWFGLLPAPGVAAAAMALSSLSVVANALRLERVALDEASP